VKIDVNGASGFVGRFSPSLWIASVENNELLACRHFPFELVSSNPEIVISHKLRSSIFARRIDVVRASNVHCPYEKNLRKPEEVPTNPSQSNLHPHGGLIRW
jgi:hypothetical protein